MDTTTGSLRLRETRHLGTKRYGAPGGHPNAPQNVFAQEAIDRLAPELGISRKDAQAIVMAFGRVAQRLLMQGHPVGIPHVGTMHLKRYRTSRAGPRNLRKYNEQTMGRAAEQDRHVPSYRSALYLHTSPAIRTLFTDNALYTGSIDEHLAVERDRQLVRRKGHGWRAVQERIMSTTPNGPIDEQVAKPKPRILVEDADSVVTTDDAGAQHVTKTPDRKAEAERRGIDEAQL